jgi:hypothetical protein
VNGGAQFSSSAPAKVGTPYFVKEGFQVTALDYQAAVDAITAKAVALS